MTLSAAISLALPLAFASFGPATAQDGGDCLSGRQIQQGIDAGEIVPLDEAMSAAGVDDRPIGRANVCKRDGNLEYHVNIMDDYGESDTKILNAQGD
jgi:hypothetical protein